MASVSKQLKHCVEMEFPDDRNTSAYNIIASVETFDDMMMALFADSTRIGEDELATVQHKVQDAIFKTDNVDVYETVYRIFLRLVKNDDDLIIHKVWPAVQANSFQIMKHIISNDETLSKMKQIDAPDQDEDADPVKIASCLTSACDVEMIEYLRGKGVEFNASSILFALKGGRMDTVRHLLDFVPFDLEGIHYSVVCDIAINACKSEGYEGLHLLKEKGWLRGPIQIFLFHCILPLDLPVDAIKIFVKESEVSELEFLMNLALNHHRLDILKYLHPSLLYLDVEGTIACALENEDEEFADFLRLLL